MLHKDEYNFKPIFKISLFFFNPNHKDGPAFLSYGPFGLQGREGE